MDRGRLRQQERKGIKRISFNYNKAVIGDDEDDFLVFLPGDVGARILTVREILFNFDAKPVPAASPDLTLAVYARADTRGMGRRDRLWLPVCSTRRGRGLSDPGLRPDSFLQA